MISINEKQQLLNLTKSNKDLTVDYETNYGVMFNLPGHEIYIYNEGDGWNYLCRSNYIREEEEEFESFDDLLNNLPF